MKIEMPKYLKWKISLATLFGILSIYGFNIVFNYAEKAEYASDFVEEYLLYTFFPEWIFWIYFSLICFMIFTNSFRLIDWIIEDRNFRNIRLKKIILERLSLCITIIVLALITLTFIIFYSYTLLPESYYSILDWIFNIAGLFVIIFAVYLIILTVFNAICAIKKIPLTDNYSLRKMVNDVLSDLKKRKCK